MTQPPKPAQQRPPRKPPAAKADAAFDLWLKRGLHQIFDGYAQEPVPEELRQIIERDKDK